MFCTEYQNNFELGNLSKVNLNLKQDRKCFSVHDREQLTFCQKTNVDSLLTWKCPDF